MTTRTDPPRLASSEDVPASLREALRDASGDGPSANDVQAITAGLGSALGPSGPSGPSGLGGATGGKIAAIVGAAALVAGGLVWSTGTSEPPPPPTDTEVSAPATASAQPALPSPAAAPTEETQPEEAEEVTEPAPEPTASAPVLPPRRVAKAEPKESPPPATSSEPVAKPSEAALLDAARKALANDPNRTLAYAQQHRSLYPDGMLAQEREVLVVEALRRLGRTDDAKKHDDDFRSRYPSSMHGRDIPVPSEGGKKN